MAHRKEPWLRKTAWADGRITSSAKGMVVPLALAIVWNVCCARLWLALHDEAIGKGPQLPSYAKAFVIVGFVLGGLAVVAVVRWSKYGRSVFEMASVPGVIGGQLAGVIRTSAKIEPKDGFRVRLSCINRMIAHGDDNIRRRLVWQDEQVITRDLLEHDPDHSAIPILFQLPHDCPATDEGNRANLTLWELEVTAEMPGWDYTAAFEVPVFRTPESDLAFVVDPSLVAKYIAVEDADRDLRAAGVVKTPSPDGHGCQFVFRTVRRFENLLPGVLGSLACIVAPFFWLHLHFGWVMVVFAVISVPIGMLLLIATVNDLIYRSVIEVSHRNLTVTNRSLGGGVYRQMKASEVVKIEAVNRTISDQSEKCYDLVIICRDGTRVTAGKQLPGHRLAMSVVHQIEQAMGRPPISVDR